MPSKNKMYEEKQKQEYIDHVTHMLDDKKARRNQQMISGYFKRISKYEEAFGKDIANMNEDEIEQTILSLKYKKEDTRSQLISNLRRYVNWAVLTGKASDANAINSVTAESTGLSDTVAIKMIENPEQIKRILEIAVNTGKKILQAGYYYKQENRAKKDRLIFWLIYCGLTIYDLIELKKEDIDFERKVIKTKRGIEYDINTDAIEIWKGYANTASLEKTGTKAKNSDVILCNVPDSEYLFRPATKNINVKTFKYGHFAKVISNVIDIYNKETDSNFDIKPDSIRISGLFYQTLIYENLGNDISVEVLAIKLRKEYGKEEINAKMRKWKIDYEDWKLAFGYM